MESYTHRPDNYNRQIIPLDDHPADDIPVLMDLLTLIRAGTLSHFVDDDYFRYVLALRDAGHVLLIKDTVFGIDVWKAVPTRRGAGR